MPRAITRSVVSNGGSWAAKDGRVAMDGITSATTTTETTASPMRLGERSNDWAEALKSWCSWMTAESWQHGGNSLRWQGGVCCSCAHLAAWSNSATCLTSPPQRWIPTIKLVLESSTREAKNRDNMILTVFKRHQIYAIEEDSVSIRPHGLSQKWITGAIKAYF